MDNDLTVSPGRNEDIDNLSPINETTVVMASREPEESGFSVPRPQTIDTTGLGSHSQNETTPVTQGFPASPSSSRRSKVQMLKDYC